MLSRILWTAGTIVAATGLFVATGLLPGFIVPLASKAIVIVAAAGLVSTFWQD